MTKRMGLVAGVSALVLGMGLAGGGAAQNAPRSNDAVTELDDVVVTARRRDERLQDVPIAIVAVQGEQLQARGVQTVLEIGRVAAGFKAEEANGRPGTLQIMIRGQRMYGITPAQDSPTAVYFADALMLPLSGMNAALHDIANIQVLKGPQGTLFGRNTTGGALTITPARPTPDFGAALSATYGNYGTNGLRGFINLPVNDQLQVRLSGYYKEHDGYQHTVTPSRLGAEQGDDEAKDFRASVVWKPTESIENYLIGYIGENRNGMNVARSIALNPNGSIVTGLPAFAALIPGQLYTPGAPGVAGDFTAVFSRFRQYENTKWSGLINTTTIDLGGNLVLKNIISYRHAQAHAFFNVGGLDIPYIDSPNDNDTRIVTEELQLQGLAFDSRLTWVVGGFAMRQASKDASMGSSLNPNNLTALLGPTVNKLNNKAIAGYVQGTFKITDKLSLTAGARYTKDIRETRWMGRVYRDPDLERLGIPIATAPFRCVVRDDAGALLPNTDAGCQLTRKKSFTEPTWTFSLDYKLTPDTMLYVAQRRGYRTGGFNQRATTGPTRVPVNAETVMDYEVGAKSDFRLADWSVRTNLAVFYDQYKNLQRTQSLFVGGVAVSSLFNAAAGNLKGAELELTVRPTSDLTFGMNYAYIDFNYTSFPFVVAGVTRDFSNRDLSGVPKHQFTAYAQYTKALAGDMGELSLTANLSYVGRVSISDTYQSKQDFATSGIYTTPAQLAGLALMPDSKYPYTLAPYTLVSARAELKGFMGKPIDVAFYMNNVFNKAAATYYSGQYESVGTAAIGFAPPRTYGVELTYRWQ